MPCSPKTLFAVALILPSLLPAALHAEDWPQWRGLNRDGACAETGLLQTARSPRDGTTLYDQTAHS